MARLRVQEISFAAALAAVASCHGGSLQGGPGGHGGSSIMTGSGGITGMNCAAVPQSVNLPSSDLLILLDTSPSMNDAPVDGACDGGCGTGSKWEQTTAAINAVVAQTDRTINWGLGFFGDIGTSSCAVVGGPVVPVVQGASRAIAGAIAGRTSASGDLASVSPRLTRPAISEAADYFTAAPDSNRKMIVLVTDGVPGSPAVNSDDTMATAQAIQNAGTRGFPTFVVGVGINASTGPEDASLQEMALAGGVPRAGSPTYYPAASTSDLVTVLNTIVASASSCVFAVPPPPNSDVDRLHIGVSVDGTELPRDTTHANGWDFADAGGAFFQVYGPPCDALTREPAAHTVQVVFKCILL